MDNLMHTVELLEEALAVAEQLGFAIRHEWMGGTGGACEIAGKLWLFVDLSLTTDEQLENACWGSPLKAVTQSRIAGISDPRVVAFLLFALMVVLYAFLH